LISMLATISWKNAGAVCLGLVLPVALSGCSGEGTIAGKVTCDGKPVSSGTVVFHSAGNAIISAPVDEGGTYRARHVPIGEAKVSVLNPVPPSDPDHPAPPKPLPDPPPVPLKYADANNGLKVDVQSGSQTFDIPLTR